MINNINKITIISPHPDDETLGVGGTIKKFSDLGAEVSILVVSGHLPPLYDKKKFDQTYNEALKAFSILGVKNHQFLKIPATFVNKEDISSLYGKINNYIDKTSPDLVFLPFPDRHIDHRIIFDGGVVACRPNNVKFPRFVLLYETLSETHWNVPGVEPNFNPDFFIDITHQIQPKINALNQFKSQIKNNTARSIEACKAQAKFRGSQNGCKFAEAFKTVRIVI